MDTSSQAARDTVAKNLARLMAESKKTQADIIRDCDISQSSMSDYLNAKKYPRPDRMQRMADYFGVLKSEIMEDSAPKIRPISNGEESLLLLFRQIHPEQQQMVLDMIQAALKSAGLLK